MVSEQLTTSGVVGEDEFLAIVVAPAPHGLERQLDEDQRRAVIAPLTESLFLVAGPGSGKTTVLTLRLLKLILVDGVAPDAILATTFTRKAAAELRHRLLSWGEHLIAACRAQLTADDLTRQALDRIDLAQVLTGTLDSLMREILTEFRPLATVAPVPIEQWMTNALLFRDGFTAVPRENRPQVGIYLDRFEDRYWHRSANQQIGFLRDLRERIIHDQIDWPAYVAAVAAEKPAVTQVDLMLAHGTARLDAMPLTDFAGLSQMFFDRLRDGSLDQFIGQLRVVLVDEYQDTNYIQEQIYFSLARAALRSTGSFAVVGDDDQSMYRFRGATVELFRDFVARTHSALGITPTTIFLSHNYRSQAPIVTWCADFAELDPGFQAARVEAKPRLAVGRDVPRNGPAPLPVLGLFRPTIGELTDALARVLDYVINRDGWTIRTRDGHEQTLKLGADGQPGDCVLLSNSVKEASSGGKVRLPGLLERRLRQLDQPIPVHNPAGKTIGQHPDLAVLCGLMLECIDPGRAVQQSPPYLADEVTAQFDRWREAAASEIRRNPRAASEHQPTGSLAAYVTAWQQRRPQQRGEWPPRVPLTHLLYQLVAWLPAFQTSITGLAYLALVARATSQAASVQREGKPITIARDGPAATASIRAALWSVFKPIAEEDHKLDEDLVGQLPLDKLSMLTIHQAKGLEFPLVIVDVGSDFDRALRSDSRRFPNGFERALQLEEEFRRFSPLDPLGRNARDRSFDDLTRQYFVAFSRAQDVLLLVGLGTPETGPKELPNVATGWSRGSLSLIDWMNDPGITLI